MSMSTNRIYKAYHAKEILEHASEMQEHLLLFLNEFVQSDSLEQSIIQKKVGLLLLLRGHLGLTSSIHERFTLPVTAFFISFRGVRLVLQRQF